MPAKKRVAKGRIQLRALVSCGKRGCIHDIRFFPRNVKSVIAIKAHLRKDGWTLTKKYGWVCGQCNYEKEKKKEEKKRVKRGEIPF